jgi:hypothetical protein
VKPRLTLFLQNEIERENDCGADIVFRFADGVSDDGNDSDPKDDRPICFNSEWWYPIFSLRIAAFRFV